jgi:enediyne biosynthesis protein E4
MIRHVILATVVALPATAQDIPQFTAEPAGVASVYQGDWQYMVGGGAAVFDCDADGYPDMLLAGGEGPASFYRNASMQGGPLEFAAQTSGLELDAVTGAYPLDVDSDGNMDIALLRVGENVLMRGTGSCKFTNANADWGFDGGDAWSTAMAATWEKGATFPTIAIGNYIDRAEEAFPWGSCTPNWLHRGAATGFAAPLPLTPSFCALSMLFTDWNRSGTPALRVSNDREYYKGGQEQLWRVEPGADPVAFKADEGWKPLKIWGMGIASADLTGDGMPDYYLTSMADNKLQVVNPAEGPLPPTFTDVAFAKKITAHKPYTGDDQRPSTGWHAQFADVNNDGLMDLFVAKGNVDAMPDFAQADPNNLMLQTADGTFIEVGDKANVASTRTSRGAALADFNLDGRLDLVVVNRREPAQVWRNTGALAGHWLQLRLAQDAPNRDAIGAWVQVRRGDVIMQQEITVGGGHAGGHTGWVHFGLGEAVTADVRVIWPDGTEGPWQTIAADGFAVLAKGGDATPWVPAR